MSDTPCDRHSDDHTSECVSCQLESALSRLSSALTERDDADRRAGAAERHVERLKEEVSARNLWLYKAKKEWGVDDRVSFDEVWKEALAAKTASHRLDSAETLLRRCAGALANCLDETPNHDKTCAVIAAIAEHQSCVVERQEIK